MSACSRNQEDLALLAGGDLPSSMRRAELLEHADGCAACQSLLDALTADRHSFAQVARGATEAAHDLAAEVPGRDLAARVMGLLAAEAHSLSDMSAGNHAGARPAHRGSRRWLTGDGLVSFGRAAAVVAVVVSASLLGLSALPGLRESGDEAGSRGPAGARIASLAGSPSRLASGAPTMPQTIPVNVHRSLGGGVDLTWDGDGREVPRSGGVVSTYRVLASASARDFSAARPVEVAGRELVTSMPLPSTQAPDRRLTFFRVE